MRVLSKASVREERNRAALSNFKVHLDRARACSVSETLQASTLASNTRAYATHAFVGTHAAKDSLVRRTHAVGKCSGGWTGFGLSKRCAGIPLSGLHRPPAQIRAIGAQDGAHSKRRARSSRIGTTESSFSRMSDFEDAPSSGQKTPVDRERQYPRRAQKNVACMYFFFYRS